jgi:hypothetical protein
VARRVLTSRAVFEMAQPFLHLAAELPYNPDHAVVWWMPE